MDIHRIEDEIADIERRLSSTPLVTRNATPDLETPVARGRLFSTSHQNPTSESNGHFPNNVQSNRDLQSLVAAIGDLVLHTNANRNMPSLPVFSAESDSVEWSSFIESFEEIMELNGWQNFDDAKKASLLRSSMTKRAADAFNGLPTFSRRSYASAKSELTKVFMNPAKVVLFQNEFDNKIQGERESLQELVNTLRRLAKRGYPEVAADRKALDSFVHRRFIDAIRNPKLRAQVRLFRRDTIDQTLVEAYRLQAALATESEEVSRIAAIRASNPTSLPPSQENRTCYRCGQRGHIARNCRSSAQLNGNRSLNG